MAIKPAVIVYNDSLDKAQMVSGSETIILAEDGAAGIPEAPVDNKLYGRKNAAWTEVTGTGGSSKQSIIAACSDEITVLTTGVAKLTFRMPYAFTLQEARASLTVAQTSGSIFTVDINENGTSILSTKLTIDNTEKTSNTAAIPPVISDVNLANDSEMTIDIDQIGDGTAKGLKVMLIGVPV